MARRQQHIRGVCRVNTPPGGRKNECTTRSTRRKTLTPAINNCVAASQLPGEHARTCQNARPTRKAMQHQTERRAWRIVPQNPSIKQHKELYTHVRMLGRHCVPARGGGLQTSGRERNHALHSRPQDQRHYSPFVRVRNITCRWVYVGK